MHRSHSRHSFPLDKRVPVMEKEHKVENVYTNTKGEIEVYTRWEGYGTISRKMEKDMHKKKQRQHNKKLCGDCE